MRYYAEYRKVVSLRRWFVSWGLTPGYVATTVVVAGILGVRVNARLQPAHFVFNGAVSILACGVWAYAIVLVVAFLEKRWSVRRFYTCVQRGQQYVEFEDEHFGYGYENMIEIRVSYEALQMKLNDHSKEVIVRIGEDRLIVPYQGLDDEALARARRVAQVVSFR